MKIILEVVKVEHHLPKKYFDEYNYVDGKIEVIKEEHKFDSKAFFEWLLPKDIDYVPAPEIYLGSGTVVNLMESHPPERVQTILGWILGEEISDRVGGSVSVLVEK